MPGATLPNMLITLPSLGGDEGIWDDELNAALSLIDAHDHTDDKGARITPAAMNINANLDFNGYFINSLGKISFQTITTPTTGTKALFVDSSDSELYWRTSAGTNVKLTSGTSLNTSLVGGILGDYASVGAKVAYDDANDVYTFQQQGSFPWARMASGPLRIYEYNTTESVYVELIAPSTLASSYTITFPTAAPGSTSVMLMDSSGVVSASNTIPNALTLSASPTAPDYKRSTAVTMMLGAEAGRTNVDPSYALAIPQYDPNVWQFGTSTRTVTYSLPLLVGDRITAFKAYLRKQSASGTLTATLGKHKMNATVAESAINTQTNNANNPGLIELGQSSLTETVAVDYAYFIRIIPSGVSGDDSLGVSVTFDRP